MTNHRSDVTWIENDHGELVPALLGPERLPAFWWEIRLHPPVDDSPRYRELAAMLTLWLAGAGNWADDCYMTQGEYHMRRMRTLLSLPAWYRPGWD